MASAGRRCCSRYRGDSGAQRHVSAAQSSEGSAATARKTRHPETGA